MSKKDQREAREKREQSELERRSKFLIILKDGLNTFAQLYRQEISDDAVVAYQRALEHLRPDQLQVAFDEAIKHCKFFPNPAEILAALKDFYDRSPMHASRDESEQQKFNEYFEKCYQRGEAYRDQMRKEEQPRLTQREPGED